MENNSKDKLNREENQQLCTKHIGSTNIETIDTESDDEDSELVEEQVAVNHRQELTDDSLPSIVQFYQCAPEENNIPTYSLLDNDFEVLAFPELFL